MSQIAIICLNINKIICNKCKTETKEVNLRKLMCGFKWRNKLRQHAAIDDTAATSGGQIESQRALKSHQAKGLNFEFRIANGFTIWRVVEKRCTNHLTKVDDKVS